MTDYFFVIIFYCPYYYPLLHIDDYICYDSCPTNTVFIPGSSCAPCYYQCATCSSPKIYENGTNCLTCPAGRVLSSGSCLCSSNSAFDDGYSSTCRSCSSTFTGTLTCSFYLDPTKTTSDYKTFFAGNWSITLIPYFTALTCTANYYVSNNLCKTCQQIFNYCLTCTNGS